MAKIYNTDCTKGLAQNAAIQQNIDKVPNELAEKIVPTFETNPELLRKATLIGIGYNAESGASTIMSTAANPITKRTFITAINMSYIKDAACDNATGHIGIIATLKGKKSQIIFGTSTLTLTAEQKDIGQVFNPPLELEPNTPVTFGPNVHYTVGNMAKLCTIYGYQIDNANA